MNNQTAQTVVRRILSAVCVFVLCGTLAAGLWPFNPFPKNEVSWLIVENGLQFGKRATIVSSGNFEVTRPQEETFCSLEIWLQPTAANGSNTILTFYSPDNPLQLRLMQYIDGLLVRRSVRDQQNHLRTIEIYIEHAFRRDKQVFLTVSSGPHGTTTYRNGVLVEVIPRFGLSSKDFSGQLVLGNSPLTYNTWQGKLLGLAIYNHELTAEQVSRHYAMWTQRRVPEVPENGRMLALYTFAERSGRIIHNSVSSEPDLYIPGAFGILHKTILTPPWREFTGDLAYVKDILVNVGGFIPLGFFCCAYLAWNRQWKRAALVTILLGGIISFTIEILQAFIPSRNSGVTDIITNTLGTSIGVLLWGWRPVQALAAKLGRSG